VVAALPTSGMVPFTVIHSSLLPSVDSMPDRTDRPIVSPVPSAAAMIVVASMSPTTINALRPARRPMLRTPRRKNTRLRTASAAISAMPSPTSTDKMTVRAPTGMPKTECMGSPRHLACTGWSAYATS
jgi:hypothetical protein